LEAELKVPKQLLSFLDGMHKSSKIVVQQDEGSYLTLAACAAFSHSGANVGSLKARCRLGSDPQRLDLPIISASAMDLSRLSSASLVGRQSLWRQLEWKALAHARNG
jgi:hypothetical protein